VSAGLLEARPSLWKRALLRSWPLLTRVVPRRHRAHRFSGGRIYLDVAESPMMLARALGLYEIEKNEALRAFLRPGSVFVDIGGNKGDFALLAGKLVGPSGRVFVFEPAPSNCEWIERSIALNGYRSIELLPIALGDREGEITLHLSRVSGHHSVIGPRSDGTGAAVRVPVRTLDSVLAERGAPRVDVLKIDVEGADMAVLQGATRTLSANRELVLLLDVHPQLGVDALALCALLRSLGFGLYALQRPFDRPLEPRADLLELVARRR
jgi:FkbM family methyltransferase